MKKILFTLTILTMVFILTGCDMDDLLSDDSSDGGSDYYNDDYSLIPPYCETSVSAPSLIGSSIEERADMTVTITNTSHDLSANDVHFSISFLDNGVKIGEAGFKCNYIGPYQTVSRSVCLTTHNPGKMYTEFVWTVTWYDSYNNYYESNNDSRGTYNLSVNRNVTKKMSGTHY